MMAKRVVVAFLLFENKYSTFRFQNFKGKQRNHCKIHAVFGCKERDTKILGDILKRKVAKSALSELLIF